MARISDPLLTIGAPVTLDSLGHAGQASVLMAPKPKSTLSWDEIGFICEGMAFASRALRPATTGINEEFSLGPRGAWILSLILNGTVYPLDIANVIGSGRSLISAELARLTEAGLIQSRKNPEDGRRTELLLTPLGEEASRRVRAGLSEIVMRQLGSYTREEMLLCARMLHDFRKAAGETGAL